MLVANSISIKSQLGPYNTQNMQRASLMKGINSKKKKEKVKQVPERPKGIRIGTSVSSLPTYLSTLDEGSEKGARNTLLYLEHTPKTHSSSLTLKPDNDQSGKKKGHSL